MIVKPPIPECKFNYIRNGWFQDIQCTVGTGYG